MARVGCGDGAIFRGTSLDFGARSGIALLLLLDDLHEAAHEKKAWWLQEGHGHG